MSKDREQKIRSMEAMIRGARAGEARRIYLELVKRASSRAQRLELASFSYRVGLPLSGVRLLAPLVSPGGKRVAQATAREKAIYAQCLARCGAGDEALRLLAGIDVREVPQVLLFKASAHVSRWEYEESIPLLLQYLRGSSGAYQKSLARLNLASAYIYTNQHRQAGFVLRDLLQESSLARWALLHGNALELAAQNHVLEREWSEADRCLNRAEERLEGTGTVDLFFVRKWRAIVDFLRSKGKSGSLDTLRVEAQERRHWETLRECDRFEALVRADRALLLKVYFGTPWKSYRRNLLQDFPQAVALPEDYLWLPDGTAQGRLELNLLTGRYSRDQTPLPSLLHRLLLLLARDFYSPIRILSLSHLLYPGEAFNPISTPAKAHEGLRRLRAWLEENGIPLGVTEEEGSYALKATAALGVRIAGAEPPAENDPTLDLGQRILRLWPETEFSVSEATTRLDKPRRTVQRQLDEMVRAGKLVRTGLARATRYRAAR